VIKGGITAIKKVKFKSVYIQVWPKKPSGTMYEATELGNVENFKFVVEALELT
jgi:hypothetical protein